MAGGKRQRSDRMIAVAGSVQVEESAREFTGVIPEGRGASRQAGRHAGRQVMNSIRLKLAARFRA